AVDYPYDIDAQAPLPCVPPGVASRLLRSRRVQCESRVFLPDDQCAPETLSCRQADSVPGRLFYTALLLASAHRDDQQSSRQSVLAVADSLAPVHSRQYRVRLPRLAVRADGVDPEYRPAHCPQAAQWGSFLEVRHADIPNR